MKKLKDLTLKEYDQYKELLLSTDDFDIFEIFKLLGYEDTDDIDVRELKLLSDEVVNQVIEVPRLKKKYVINGRKFKPVLMMNEIKAAQFIDFQTYMKEFKLHKVLSVFLLPIKIGIFKFETVQQYNDGYDMMELQEFLYNNFKVGDAMALSNFFLELSVQLLPLIRNSLILETMRMKEKNRRKEMKKK